MSPPKAACAHCSAPAPPPVRLYVGRPAPDSSGGYDLRPVEVAFCPDCLRRLNRFWLLFAPAMALLSGLGAWAMLDALELPGAAVAFGLLVLSKLAWLGVFVRHLLLRRRMNREPGRFFRTAWLRWCAAEGEVAFTEVELRRATAADGPPGHEQGEDR